LKRNGKRKRAAKAVQVAIKLLETKVMLESNGSRLGPIFDPIFALGLDRDGGISVVGKPPARFLLLSIP
jgi:hypothetical protein